MSYAIFRSAPIHKLKDLGHIGAHNQRKKEAYNSNPDIDILKANHNIEIVSLKGTYRHRFYEITKPYREEHDERQETIREDRKKSFHQMVDDSRSVVADELLFTATHDFFKDASRRSVKEWANTCMEFVYEDMGYTKDQVLHATVHMDEKTPHLHCVVVPLVQKLDKRTNTERLTISKKEYIHDKSHLSELQDKYHQRMIDNGYELKRGIKGSDNEHIQIKEFKKITSKLDNNLKKQNNVMTRTYDELEQKLAKSKPTIRGNEVKIDKDTYDTLKTFMDSSKRVIEDIPKNKELFHQLEDYTSRYKEIETENHHVKQEVQILKQKNDELQKENNQLHIMLIRMAHQMKEFFRKIFKRGNEREKEDTFMKVITYYKQDIYTSQDLRDISVGTSSEKPMKKFLNYSKSKAKDFDRGM